MVYDCIVIGAGVTGAFIARELSRYQLSVCLVEKGTDVAMGTSKANSAIVHAGFDAKPGTLKATLNVLGNELMEQICNELNVPFKRIGSLVLAFHEDDVLKLQALKTQGQENGVKGLEIFTKEQLDKIEPNLSPDVVSALHAPSAGIVCPYELTLHAAENAVENGVELRLDSEVHSIVFSENNFIVTTNTEELKCRYLVNAAGLSSDAIARMAGDHSFSIHPRRGEYMLYDRKMGGMAGKVIFQLPSNKGKGILVTPTVDGNLLIGPNAEEITDKEDMTTTENGLNEVLESARKSVPALSKRDIITSFAGLRAGTTEGDFIVRESIANSKLIHAAGIESPGLTAAPAIGVMVVRILAKNGLELKPKTNFNPVRKSVIRFREMDPNTLNALVKENPSYGRIVCRCESVTEAEVINSIHSTIGARDLDGVKRRTRAGMGRCQGGFCSGRIVEILSRELDIPMEDVTKSGGKSRILAGRTK